MLKMKTRKICRLLFCLLLIPFVVWVYNLSLESSTQHPSIAAIQKTNVHASALSDDQAPIQDNKHGLFHKTMTLRKLNQAVLSQFLKDLGVDEDKAASQLAMTLHGPFSLSNDSLCVTPEGSPVDMLFFVHTAVPHFERRQKLRSTFMAEKHLRPFHLQVRRVFLVGRGNDSLQQARLEEEHAQHGDLVQADFLDTYHNLSLKGVMGFRWITLHCPAVRLLVKMDDDVLLNTFKLMEYYRDLLSTSSRTILCNVAKFLPIQREGKWKVDSHLFQGRLVYPNYCHGMAVLMTGDIVPDLLQAAKVTPVFWIDDVYLYGMLPAVASNITFYNVGDAAMNHCLYVATRCVEYMKELCALLAVQAEELDFDRLLKMIEIISENVLRTAPSVGKVNLSDGAQSYFCCCFLLLFVVVLLVFSLYFLSLKNH